MIFITLSFFVFNCLLSVVGCPLNSQSVCQQGVRMYVMYGSKTSSYISRITISLRANLWLNTSPMCCSVPSGCVKTAGLLKCGRCLNAKYCSKNHQQLHYRLHKHSCFECNKTDFQAETCSICLETLSEDEWRAKEHFRFSCCGKKAHYECSKRWNANCPYCRTPLPQSKKESFELLKANSTNRKPWALLDHDVIRKVLV